MKYRAFRKVQTPGKISLLRSGINQESTQLKVGITQWELQTFGKLHIKASPPITRPGSMIEDLEIELLPKNNTIYVEYVSYYVREFVQEKGPNPLWSLCLQSPQTTKHLFLLCWWTKEIWSEPKLKIKIPHHDIAKNGQVGVEIPWFWNSLTIKREDHRSFMVSLKSTKCIYILALETRSKLDCWHRPGHEQELYEM